jgi:outer membrane protein assembly factor BamE
MHIILRLITLLFVLSLAACSSDGGVRIPGLYRIDIQQGNVIDQVMIDRLRPGMDKSQVHFILGTPAIVDPFHTDQWEYLYTMSDSGKTRVQRHLRIHFKDEKLAWIDGDVVATGRPPADALRQSRTVEVPLRDNNGGGFFRNLFNAIPFIGDDSSNTDRQGNDASTPAEKQD